MASTMSSNSGAKRDAYSRLTVPANDVSVMAKSPLTVV
jgi:hypothetical protein